MNAEFGSLNVILKQLLITGFNSKSVTGIVVVFGIATVTIPSGHGFVEHSWVRIAGATETILNDDWQIYDVSTTSFKFAVPGGSSFTASGTITAMFATPGSWSIVAEDLANYKLMIKSTHPNSSGVSWYFEDNKNNGADSAYTRKSCTYVRGVKSYTDISTLTETFANTYIRKRDAWSGTAGNVGWVIVADESMVHIFNRPIVSADWGAELVSFGDPISLQPNDEYHAIFIGADPNYLSSTVNSWEYYNTYTSTLSTGYFMNTGNGKFVCRQTGGVIRNAPITLAGSGFDVTLGGYFSTACTLTPNLAGNTVLFHDIFIRDPIGIRAKYPGVKQFLHAQKLQNKEVFADSSVNRRMMSIHMNAGYSGTYGAGDNNSTGVCLVDITGPWR